MGGRIRDRFWVFDGTDGAGDGGCRPGGRRVDREDQLGEDQGGLCRGVGHVKGEGQARGGGLGCRHQVCTGGADDLECRVPPIVVHVEERVCWLPIQAEVGDGVLVGIGGPCQEGRKV